MRTNKCKLTDKQYAKMLKYRRMSEPIRQETIKRKKQKNGKLSRTIKKSV